MTLSYYQCATMCVVLLGGQILEQIKSSEFFTGQASNPGRGLTYFWTNFRKNKETKI